MLSATVQADAPQISLPAWREWNDPSPLPSTAVVMLSFVGHTPSGAERRRVLEGLYATLPSHALIVVADHNRPRMRLAALAAVLGPPVVPGGSPAARWRRLAEPAAREVQGAGFRVVRLELVAHERVQLVIARRAPA